MTKPVEVPTEAVEEVKEPLVAQHTEFETKYRVEAHLLTEFKRTMGTLPNMEKFIYVEGPDDYFVKPNSDRFARYRRPSFGLDGNRSEVTWKTKQVGAKNNIQRKEINWRVDGTPDETIRAALEDDGYVFNFSIWKGCHIYIFTDATLVFYSVFDQTDGKATKMDSFVEIEVSEEKVSSMTEEEAWGIITKYEKALSELDLNPQRRLRKSLFEMYRREAK